MSLIVNALEKRGFSVGALEDVDYGESDYLYRKNSEGGLEYVLALLSDDKEEIVGLTLWDDFPTLFRKDFGSDDEFADYLVERFNELWAEYHEFG